ncbi:MAG: hypothetical protein HY648_03860, partial [Acidobacteria bacterium]|nr:hypothetical protein [Acidobacteriota bacterium]
NQFPFPVRRADGALFFPADCDAPELAPQYRNPTFCRPGAGPRNPAFGSMHKTNTDGQSFYNAVLLSVRSTLGRGLSFGGNYTYAKNMDDSSSGAGGGVIYGHDRKLNRGPSTYDIRQRLSLNYFYSLPFGSGQRWLSSGWLAPVLGNWRLSGILSVRSGAPVDPDYGIPTPGFLFTNERPDLLPGYSNNPIKGATAGCAGVAAGRELGGPGLYFDPCAFGLPEPGTVGTATTGRNTIIGPRTVNLDLSLQKNFILDSRRNLQFRAEFFNLANHANFASPTVQGLTIFRNARGTRNPSAGRLTSTSGSPRQIQFALRLTF